MDLMDNLCGQFLMKLLPLKTMTVNLELDKLFSEAYLREFLKNLIRYLIQSIWS